MAAAPAAAGAGRSQFVGVECRCFGRFQRRRGAEASAQIVFQESASSGFFFEGPHARVFEFNFAFQGDHL